MKKILLSCLSLTFLIACNENGSKKESDKTIVINQDSVLKAQAISMDLSPQDSIILQEFCTGPGSANYIVSAAVANSMVSNFSPYQIGNPNLKPNYWVDKCIVEALATFFNKPTEYDGVWIIFGADPTGDLNKSTIFIVPTKTPIGTNYHISEFGVTIPGTNCASVPINYFAAQTVAEPQILKFRDRYRHESIGSKIDKLSKKVWINSCVFKSLNSILKLYTFLDGISICSAAYSGMMTGVKGQTYTDQSTVVIVATQPGETLGTHDPVWELNTKYYTKSGTKVYNHGELCPSACNITDL